MIPAAVAGRHGPKAVAAGEAWIPAGGAAADLAAVEAGGAAADFAVAAEVFGASAGENIRVRENDVRFWRIGYVPPNSESQT